jgi:tripartite-type tricarboxylate transporter receptor subunit TctC
MNPFCALLAALLGCLFTSAACAQGYPDRQVRMLVGFPPGGAPDLTARVVAQALSETWGKPVVVEAVTGAAGNIAAGHAAKAASDGYTLLMSGDAAMTTNVSLYEKLPYDPLKDFSPITLVTIAPNVMMVHPSLTARSINELVALAKAQPGKLTYASSGSGTSQHLAGELFRHRAGVDIVHVPYKAAASMTQDLLAGRVDMVFANFVIAQPLLKEGKMRGLAVSSLKRASAAPDVPTMSELGFPDFEAVAWFGLLAPAGTPQPVIRKVHQDTVAALALPAVRSRLINVGLEVVGSTPQEFANRIRDEIAEKGKLVRASGAKAD